MCESIRNGIILKTVTLLSAVNYTLIFIVRLKKRGVVYYSGNIFRIDTGVRRRKRIRLGIYPGGAVARLNDSRDSRIAAFNPVNRNGDFLLFSLVFLLLYREVVSVNHFRISGYFAPAGRERDKRPAARRDKQVAIVAAVFRHKAWKHRYRCYNIFVSAFYFVSLNRDSEPAVRKFDKHRDGDIKVLKQI